LNAARAFVVAVGGLRAAFVLRDGEERSMIIAARRRIRAAATTSALLSLVVMQGYGIPRPADAASDIVAQAKAAVAEYAGPQTTWKGPTSAPKPAAGMKIVYLSGDEQNDISHEYGVYIKEAATKIGWTATVIDGKGSPTSWLAGMDQAIALKPNGIVMFADAKSLQPAIARGLAEGVKFVGIHAAGLPGPQPDLHLFMNIEEDPREIGKAEADWAIAESDGKARVVFVSHNEYAIASVKSHASEDEVTKCSTL
jgi:ribose transport system substrate-binding protein